MLLVSLEAAQRRTAGCACSSRPDDARCSRRSRHEFDPSARRGRRGGRISDVDREAHITRLGEGVDAVVASSPSPSRAYGTSSPTIDRNSESLGAERTLLIATSAVRDAENGEAFLGEIEWSYGFKTQLLAGDDEAMMMFRGRHGRSARARRRRLSSTSAAARPSSCTSRRARSLARQPRRRLCSAHRALPRLGSAVGPELAAAGAYVRSLLPDDRGDERDRSRGHDHDARNSRPRRCPLRLRSRRTATVSPRASVEAQLERLASMTDRGARRRARDRARSRAGDRLRASSCCGKCSPVRARGDRGRASETSSTAPRSWRQSCPSRRRRGSARCLHVLLSR